MGSKYYDERHRFDNLRDTPITTPNFKDETKIYYCNSCHKGPLSTLRSANNLSYFCRWCNMHVDVEQEQLRSKSKVLQPEGPNIINANPSVAYAPEVGIKRKQKEIKGALKAISERKGVKITSYKEGKG